MSLEPFFSLSPLSPSAITYNAANPSAPHANAYLDTFGGFTRHVSPRTFSDQHSNNQILLGYDPVLDTDQTITTLFDSFYRRCAVSLTFSGHNVSTRNQYLLVFRLARAFGHPTAQFFVGTSFVRSEPLTQSPYDDIAILLDTPGNDFWVYAYVRLAGDFSYYHGFFFKGVDCYLL
jgi:hypothetical protein